jgi:hypothetical protein
MGTATRAQAGFSTVVIRRQFRVDSPAGERLLLSDAVGMDMKNARFAVRAVIGRYQNGGYRIDHIYPALAGVAGSRPFTFTGGRSISAPVGRPGQTYALTLSITYAKQADGFWRDHRVRHRHASHHRFEFGPA